MDSELFLSVHTAMAFGDCLDFLKQSLFRADFQIIAEVPFHRTFQRHFGLRTDAYDVLLIWVPFQALRALVGDRSAGLFNPFPIVVADDGEFTTVSAPNHDFLRLNSSSLAIQVLARDLNRRMRRVFAELAAQDKLVKNVDHNEYTKAPEVHGSAGLPQGERRFNG